MLIAQALNETNWGRAVDTVCFHCPNIGQAWSSVAKIDGMYSDVVLHELNKANGRRDTTTGSPGSYGDVSY